MRLRILASVVLLSSISVCSVVYAQDQATKPVELTPTEIAEEEGRTACQVAICSAFCAKKAGPDLACGVV